jgi:hypothetical protein
MRVLRDDDPPADKLTELLQDNIRNELRAQNATGDLGLSDVQIGRLAWGIAAEVLYAFAVKWDPDWVDPGEPHTWTEGGKFGTAAGLVDSSVQAASVT